MRLTLTYSGPLHSQADNNTRILEKHKLRSVFHKQLNDLWITHPALEGIYEQWDKLAESQKLENKDMVSVFDIGDFRFLPLVIKRLFLSCDLDILFLRREPAGYIIDDKSGDIDNRVKVLFDALRKPRRPEEIPSSAQADPSRKPIFCLLEDDSLITSVKVETDRLLEPFPPERSKSDVKLIVRVKIKTVKALIGTLGWGGD